ncbi:hypothetical protein LTR66_011792 [Elasticomyces elasticus]|nr:hypothetical protein LTR66_011792 [Elasticomyces elasticus]
MPHEDGDAYWPIVATVSLGASIVLDIYDKREDIQEDQHIGDGGVPQECTVTSRNVVGQKEENAKQEYVLKPRWHILQEPRSLLVTTSTAYTDLMHGIAEIEVDQNLESDGIANWALLGDCEVFKDGSNRRESRISLTYRDVLRVSKLGAKVLGRGKT